jgi:hypothetical protein
MKDLAKLLLISLAACTATEQDPALALDVRDADHVSGTFAADGLAIAFDFSRQGDRHVMAFQGADGRALITMTLDGALLTTNIFDGRLVASGIANAPDPTIEGDRAAMEELHALPEAGLLEGLRDALVAAGIDQDLYLPKLPPVAGVYDYDGYYFAFWPGDSNTWFAYNWTQTIKIWNRWPRAGACAAVRLDPGPQYLVVWPYSQTVKTTYFWWATLFSVHNFGIPTAWGSTTCQPASILVHVDP